jgi:hypothetical protein
VQLFSLTPEFRLANVRDIHRIAVLISGLLVGACTVGDQTPPGGDPQDPHSANLTCGGGWSGGAYTSSWGTHAGIQLWGDTHFGLVPQNMAISSNNATIYPLDSDLGGSWQNAIQGLTYDGSQWWLANQASGNSASSGWWGYGVSVSSGMQQNDWSPMSYDTINAGDWSWSHPETPCDGTSQTDFAEQTQYTPFTTYANDASIAGMANHFQWMANADLGFSKFQVDQALYLDHGVLNDNNGRIYFGGRGVTLSGASAPCDQGYGYWVGSTCNYETTATYFVVVYNIGGVDIGMSCYDPNRYWWAITEGWYPQAVAFHMFPYDSTYGDDPHQHDGETRSIQMNCEVGTREDLQARGIGW